MALNDLLKKIAVNGIDTKGLYYKDSSNLFSKKEIGRGDLNKINYQPITIVIKLYYRNKQIKKTIAYNNLTGLQVIKQAATERNILKAELEDRGVIIKKTFQSLNDLWEEYIEHKKITLSPDNIYSMQTFYAKWIKRELGDINITKIITADLQSIVKKILTTPKEQSSKQKKDAKTKEYYKPRTAKTVQDIMRPLFNYAIDQNIVQFNPAIKIEIPKFDNTVDFELSEQKRLKLFDEIQKYEIMKYRGIMLFLYYGRRLNEALTLSWRSIYFDQNIYVVEAIYAKNTRRTEYPLPKVITNFLQEYSVQKDGFIFPGETTEHVTESTFRRHWKKVTQRAGIEGMRIHDTRHALGNTFINRGESLENIGKVLGHSSVAVTKRYAKTSLQTADRLLSDY
ncbi:MAG: site-specific integrase [Thiovulaceae bacterium]|jgi:site-specific recombinase XerD|nr:site-specific integrase [Sulfurimonadaceae bacterium]